MIEKNSVLSKSKLMAFRQCPRRLWLEVNGPERPADSAATQARFRAGHEVGEVARRLYDPNSRGAVLDPIGKGDLASLVRTPELLLGKLPIFEAGFSHAGAKAYADVLLPVRSAGPRRWRLIEVKSTSKVKDYHRDDVAIQAHLARACGVRLASVAVAHIDTAWVYPGGADYRGLLVEHEFTTEALQRGGEVEQWISRARAVVRRRKEPTIGTGDHCDKPYPCSYVDHCTSGEPQADHPVRWLPDLRSKKLKDHLQTEGIEDLSEVPDELLNDLQRRVKRHTLAGKVYFDAAGAKSDLAGAGWPLYFMDFETVAFAVPAWTGTRPYENLPFQFSVHRLASNGRLTHTPFIDLSGKDPTQAFAKALIAACGKVGPIYAYNASFERGVVKALAARHTKLVRPLLAIHTRVADLLPVAKARYYHPRQQGSWSLKQVLPAVAPDLDYADLDGVQDGEMAMEAYHEAVSPSTTAARRRGIERELLDYCALDTMALIRLWQHFTGRSPRF